MKRVGLFALICAFAGLTALLGSLAGAAIGHESLFVGGIVGGLVGVYIAAWVAKLRHLITPAEMKPTAIGGGIGFLVAVAIAVSNLHTPVIPILSTGLTGVGSLIGLAFHRRRNKIDEPAAK